MRRAGISRQGAMHWHLFLGASVLVCGLLLERGAPLPSVVVSIGLAAFFHWTRGRVVIPPGSQTGA